MNEKELNRLYELLNAAITNFEYSHDTLKMYSSVNVYFTNNENKEDETQLTARGITTNVGKDEFTDFISYLSNELDTTLSKIDDIEIVATADTEEDLIAIEY